MAQFQGNFTGTYYGSEAARDRHEKRALRDAWGDYEAYVQKDDERRTAIDAALDNVMAERMGQSAVSRFVELHPEVELPANAAAIERYFSVRGITGPFDLFKLEAAYGELAGDGLIEPLDGVE